MNTLNNINSNDEFFVSAYTEINAVAEPTTNTVEFVVPKESTKDFLLLIRENEICKEIENDLQLLSEKVFSSGNRPLLTSFISINKASLFAEHCMILSCTIQPQNHNLYFELVKYINDAKNNGANMIVFEGYKL